MALHTVGPTTLLVLHSLFIMAMLLLFVGPVVKGCFPLMSSAAGGCGGGCCMPGGCVEGGGAVPMVPSSEPAYVYPSYPSYPVQPGVPYAAKARSMAMAPSSATHTAVSTSTDCAKRYTDTRLSCALPFERRTPSDESECRRHCANAMPRCRSFQLDSTGSVCDLFEHSLTVPSSSTGRHNDYVEDQWLTKVGTKKRRNNGAALLSGKSERRRQKRFFLQSGVPLDHQSRTMAAVGGGGNGNSLPQMAFSRASSTLALSPASSVPASAWSSCVPTLEPLAGSVFVGFDSACISVLSPPSPATSSDPFLLTDDQNEETGAELSADENALPAPLPPPPPPSRKTSKTSFPSGESLEPFLTSSTVVPLGHTNAGRGNYGSGRGERGGQAEAEMETTLASAGANGLASDRNSDCAVDGTRAHVQLIDGIALTDQSPIAHVRLDSADVCLHVCRQNAFLDGRRLPSPCRSATFHRQNGRCEFLSGAISPNGVLQYMPNPDSLYFEKICIPRNELAPGCDDVIHRIPQHHLDPRRTNDGGTVQTANSQLDCVRKCIGAKTQLGFKCASVSFFFDWHSQNCYLSRFTRLSRPDLYVAERRELVDYMEMPPCFQLPARVRLHDVPTVSPIPLAWGPCIDGMRWRKKNCTKNGAEEDDGEEEKCVEREFCGKKEAATGKGCGERGQCGDGYGAQKAPIPSAEEMAVEKQIAPNFEVAKRFNGPPVASEEASATRPNATSPNFSLFGEQDYEHQKEISFFGPPQLGSSEASEHIAKTATGAQCDVTKKCCPIGTGEGVVRGCSLGRRTLADGRTVVSCVPDDCQ